MVKPQLLGQGFTSGSLFNSDANLINSESLNIDAQLFHFGIPLSSITENIGLRAIFKVIQIAGQFRGTASEMKTFVENIEDQMEAPQSEINYTSGINKKYTVKINNFTHNTSPNTNIIGWTLQFYDETITSG